MRIYAHRKFSGQQYNKVKNQERIVCLTSTPTVEVDSVPSLLLGIASLCSFFESEKFTTTLKMQALFQNIAVR